MKKFLPIVAAALCGFAFSVSAAEIKIGVVNVQRVLEQAPQAEAARKRLEAEFAPRDKGIVEMKNDVRKGEEKLEKDGMIMSESERQKLDRDLVAQKRDLKRKQEEFRDDLNMRQNEEFGKLQKRIADVIRAVAKENNYDLILTDGVLFMSDKVEITDAVLQRLVASDKEPAAARSGGNAKGGQN